MYDTDGSCSTTSGDYTYGSGDNMDQNTEINNGKYICLYGEDAAGNITTTGSTNDINIDATGPTTPTLVSPLSGTLFNTGSIDLVWNPSVDT